MAKIKQSLNNFSRHFWQTKQLFSSRFSKMQLFIKNKCSLSCRIFNEDHDRGIELVIKIFFREVTTSYIPKMTHLREFALKLFIKANRAKI